MNENNKSTSVIEDCIENGISLLSKLANHPKLSPSTDSKFVEIASRENIIKSFRLLTESLANLEFVL